MVKEIDQLSFAVDGASAGLSEGTPESREEHLEKIRQHNRAKKIAACFSFLRLANQSFRASEIDLQKLKKRLALPLTVYNLIATEVLLSQQDRFADEISHLYKEEETKMARAAVARAILQDSKSVELLEEACFYCKRDQQEQCDFPKADKDLKVSFVRMDFPSRTEMDQFVEELNYNPDAICCPKKH